MRSIRFSSGVLTAATVCRLTVSGFGYISTRPSGESSVRSSDRNEHGWLSSVFRMVVVLPVSVCAVIRYARPSTAMHAACTSA